MSQLYPPHVVTANALIDGDVVYFTADDRWSATLAQAEVITDEAHAQIRLLDAQSRPQDIVGAYLTRVDASAQTPAPAHFRERFRATGPSNYPHGKQEAQHV